MTGSTDKTVCKSTVINPAASSVPPPISAWISCTMPHSSIAATLNIMNAKKILILANGANKAKAVYGLVKGEVTENVPASVLQLHPDCTLVCDEAAASLL